MNDNSSATNPGWKQADQWYLNRHDNVHTPDIRVITEDNLEESDPELREYWCAICKSKLDYLKNIDMWYCEACVQYYDTNIQDVPLKNIKDSRVKTYAELEHYHQLDDEDIHLSFVEGINPDADSEDYVPRNVEVISDNGHHRHIRVKGLPTEALAAMNEMDDK